MLKKTLLEMDESHIFSRPAPKNSKWQNIIEHAPVEYHMLFFLVPLFEEVDQRFSLHLKTHYPKLCTYIDPALLDDLLKQLYLNLIFFLLSRTLVMEMHILSKAHALEGDTPQARYHDFVHGLCAEENIRLFKQKYPVAWDQMHGLIRQYLCMLDEFFNRFCQDRDALIRVFLQGKQTMRLSAITQSGDKHKQGQTTLTLRFSDGKTSRHLIYKPHSLSIDKGIHHVLNWINQHHTPIQFKTYAMLLRKEYGYCEYVPFKACSITQDVKKYYYNLGCLLMILHAFRAKDIHGENLIAHGSYPVIVDYECFLSPEVLIHKKRKSRLPPFNVLSTLLLPFKVGAGKEHPGFDISAMGWNEQDTYSYKRLSWVDAGKDTMRAKRESVLIRESRSQPKYRHQKVDFLNHEAAFCQGFSDTYTFILDHMEEMMSKKGPFKAFQGAESRMVLRPTAFYSRLIVESYHPKYMHDPRQFKRFFKTHLGASKANTPAVNAQIESEYQDLITGNIPYFSIRVNRLNIQDSRQRPIPHDVSHTPYHALLIHLHQQLNQQDLGVQLLFIQNAFSACRINSRLASSKPGAHPSRQAPKKHRGPVARPSTQLSHPALQKEIHRIVRRELDWLLAHQIQDENMITWPCLTMLESNEWQSHFSGLELYDGLAGISLSFLYAGRLLKDERYLHQAQAGLNIIQHTVKQNIKKMSKQPDIQKSHPIPSVFTGGFYGLGSELYTLAEFYRLNHRAPLKRLIIKMLDRIPHILRYNGQLDVMNGCAGLLASILALEDIISHKILVYYAQLCVLFILKAYPHPSEFPKRAFYTPSAQPLLGFSHGVSGILWALSRYEWLSKDPIASKWIKEGLHYEHLCFDSHHKNWPDYRMGLSEGDVSENKPMVAWCHGAAGIGLARYALLQRGYNTPEVQQDLYYAIEKTLTEGFTNAHTLCHGDLGNLELLWLSQHLNPHWADQYNKQSQAIVFDLKNPAYTCSTAPPNASPGLMTGRAGVAYQLLRIAHPEEVPSVILLRDKPKRC